MLVDVENREFEVVFNTFAWRPNVTSNMDETSFETCKR